MVKLRTGIDLVEIERLSRLKPEIKQRFLTRVFTTNEVLEANNNDSSLAGRFAAKEAVAKALGCGIGPVQWKDIEIRKGPNGEPYLILHNKAHTIAKESNLETWSISISHTNTHAVAIAVAIGIHNENTSNK